jgi:hypothetical protein
VQIIVRSKAEQRRVANLNKRKSNPDKPAVMNKGG